MSVLAILLPPRGRLAVRAAAAEAAPGPTAHGLPSAWSHVYSSDGRTVAQAGSAAPALLPKADHTVLVLADADVSWHRVDIPRAPPARLRAALLGVMEEVLLDDDEALHFALAPGAAAGQPGWVAVTHRERLAAALATLEAAGLSIERVVVAATPLETAGGGAHGHFYLHETPDTAAPWLALSRAGGVACLSLQGALARSLLPAAGAAARWTATPACAAAAERWLDAPVALLTDAERALEAVQGGINLRQFDLAARHRGTRALREAGKRILSSEWRPVRAGVIALLVLQVVGLNVYAWQQRRAIDAKRLAMNDLLKATHPGVRAVLDAPLQMQRETERLRAAAGRPGENDLEALMAAAAAAWPDGLGPVQTLRFEAGRLTLVAPGWGEPQMTQFRERLRAAGYLAEQVEGRVTVTRAPTRGLA
jgi:general secretion pathway protein L